MRRSAGNLTAKRYVYFWVDGIYFSARMEEEKQCILVIVGATDKGQKELRHRRRLSESEHFFVKLVNFCPSQNIES